MPKTTKAAPAGDTAKRAASRAKTASKEATGDRFLVDQRAELIAERASYVEAAESLRLDAEALAEDMEPGDIQFDEESGEGDTLNVERERDLALSAQARAAVDEIDRALAKMDAGTYGVCERCGNPIPKARLKALPYAALCVACKSGGLSRR
jgi:DnaK suppressor protein